MALITAAQTGNYNDTATWVGGAIPVDGDRIDTSTFTVTVPAGYTANIGTPGDGTTAVAVGTGGGFVVKGTAVINGNLIYNPGATFFVDGSTSAAICEFVKPYSPSRNNIAGTISYFKVIGTAATKAILRAAGGSGTSTINMNSDSNNLYTKVIFNDAFISGWGSTSANSFDFYGFTAAQPADIQRTVFHNCGKVVMTMAANNTYTWSRVDIRSPNITAGNDCASFAAPAKESGGISVTLDYFTVYSATLVNITCNHVEIVVQNSVFYNCNWTSAGRSLTTVHQRNSYIRDVAGGTNLITVCATSASQVKNNVFVSRFSNPHYVGDVAGDATSTANLIHDNAFDGFNYFNTDAGDCVLGRGTFDLQRNIMINKSGTMFTALFTTSVFTCSNNTAYASYGGTLGETNGAAGQLTSFINNLISDQGDALHQQSAMVAQNNLTLNNNCYYAMSTAGNIDHPSGFNSGIGAATYAGWFSSGSYGDANKGENDISINPLFKNAAATVAAFGAWANIAAVAAALTKINGTDTDGSATTAYTKAAVDILSYIRWSFTPKNLGLSTTGVSGTYIGAIAPAAGGTESGASNLTWGFKGLGFDS